MLSVNTIRRCFARFLPYVIPTVFSVAAAWHLTALHVLLFVLSLFLVLFLTPRFRGAENIGMFAMLAVSVHPLNLRIAIEVFPMLDLYDVHAFLGCLRGILCFAILFSVEQLVMGYITRLLLPRQRILKYR